MIPKSDRAHILKSLHKYHFSEIAMVSQAKTRLYWPNIMLDIKHIWESCVICQTLRRAHNPSIPLNEEIFDHRVMDVLSADWGQLGSNYYLIVVDKSSAYVWCQRFTEQSTDNTIRMLTDIFNQYGRPKELIADSGPAFLQRFHKFC